MEEELLRDAIYKFLGNHSLSELLEILSLAVAIKENTEQEQAQ